MIGGVHANTGEKSLCASLSGETRHRIETIRHDQQHAWRSLVVQSQNRRCDDTFCKPRRTPTPDHWEPSRTRANARSCKSGTSLKTVPGEAIPTYGAEWSKPAFRGSRCTQQGVSRAISVKPSVEPRETVKNNRYTSKMARLGE